ncbi:hypothetical protein OY671_011054, partial [Metschnikowia pulcherrima]
GPLRRRRPHPAVRHAALPPRRADRRRGDGAGPFGLPARNGSLAHPGSGADHQALHRRAPGCPARAGRQGGCRSGGWRRAAHDRRRADLHRRRRFRGARMEQRGGRSDQGRLCRPADPPAARTVRAGIAAPPRAGQVVSWRKPAASGLCDLSARRWRADSARSVADRR